MMNSTNNDAGLSRKDKLKQWRAERGKSTVGKTSKSDINTRQPSAASRAGSGDKENNGALVERPTNRVHKRPAARENKAFMRKPFRVSTRSQYLDFTWLAFHGAQCTPNWTVGRVIRGSCESTVQ